MIKWLQDLLSREQYVIEKCHIYRPTVWTPISRPMKKHAARRLMIDLFLTRPRNVRYQMRRVK